MREINLDDLAAELVTRADFPLEKDLAKSFIKKSLGNILGIIKQSKGKIMFRHCGLLQAYRKPNIDDLKNQTKDLNETKTPRNGLWPYSL